MAWIASACPGSRIEPVEDRDGAGSHLRVPCQDLIEGRVPEAVLETGLRPRPMRLVFLEDRGEPVPPDLALDRDQMAGDLTGTPLPSRERRHLRRPGGLSEAVREPRERLDQFVPAHATTSSSTRFGASQRAASSSRTPLRAA